MPQTNYNHVYHPLQDYMLTTNNMSKFTKEIIKSFEKQAPKKVIKKICDIFSPSQQDQLFWCFYICLYGMNIYELNLSREFTIEKEFKITTIEKIRKKPQLLKTHKLRKNSIEDELANCKKITMNGLHALCLYYNINIFYINNNKYHEIITCSDKPVHMIDYKEKEYGLRLNVTEDKLIYYRENYWLMENLSKPLKAISNYKHADLVEICKKLGIELLTNNKKKDKKEMYQNILNKL